MRQTASVNHAFRADVLFIGDISIGVKDSAIVFEEFFGDLLASRHLEVEDNSLHRRAVLPEVSFMVLANLLRRPYTDVRFVGLDVAAGKQIALHNIHHGS